MRLQKSVQNKDKLYKSDIKLYEPQFFFFENVGETEVLKVQRSRAICPSYRFTVDWAMYHKNVWILFSDRYPEIYYAIGDMLGENSEPLKCRLEDEVVYSDGLRMIMLQGGSLMKRVTEIVDRVVEAGLYNYWISQEL